MSRLSRQCGILNISQPYRPPQPVTGIVLLYFFTWFESWPSHWLSCCFVVPRVCHRSSHLLLGTGPEASPRTSFISDRRTNQVSGAPTCRQRYTIQLEQLLKMSWTAHACHTNFAAAQSRGKFGNRQSKLEQCISSQNRNIPSAGISPGQCLRTLSSNPAKGGTWVDRCYYSCRNETICCHGNVGQSISKVATTGS
jgi:hypothetical protein